MSLVAFHAGRLWLRASRSSETTSAPSPYQFFLAADMVSHLSPISFLRFLWYAIAYRPLTRQSSAPQRGRKPISPMLLMTAALSFSLFSLSLGIKVLDIVLHEQLFTVVLPRGHALLVNATTVGSPLFQVGYLSDPAHFDGTDRFLARAGSHNMSDTMAIYPAPPLGNMSLAFLGPKTADFAVAASTVALGTSCVIRRPTCETSCPVPNNTNHNCEMLGCGGIDDPTGIVYLTTDLGTQPQIALWDNSTDSHQYGSTQAPFQHLGFMCFKAFSPFPHIENSTDNPEAIPFASWDMMLEPGYDNIIDPSNTMLCFTYTCWSTTFRATYSATQGASVTLDLDSLVQIDDSVTTIAVSRTLPNAGLWVANGIYSGSARYLDAQLQDDVNTLGNVYGNNSAQLNQELAQTFSNRLLGWSVGALILAETNGTHFEDVISLSIPLIPAGLFVGFHLVYALLALILGFSALLLPRKYHPAESRDLLKLEQPQAESTLRPASSDSSFPPAAFPPPSQEGSSSGRAVSDPALTASGGSTIGKSHLISDLLVAQGRLSDPSTLVYDVVQSRMHPQLDSRPRPEADSGPKAHPAGRAMPIMILRSGIESEGDVSGLVRRPLQLQVDFEAE
ncbi:hypothetical protein DL93DRAFT_2166923 [Clavulina sp. PMI_390]|nr:hypothetical protein DL93DRAFT_2166923 [Clavulina sp. PMI_390]